MKDLEYRQRMFQQMFITAFGENWQKECAPERLEQMTVFCHKVTSFLMGAYIAHQWPKTWPSRSIDVAWTMWHETFEDDEKSRWALFSLKNNRIMAEHSATEVKFVGEYHELAQLLCRMFLCQAWYIATG